MREIQKQAQERGFFVVVEGSNTDDENDYRPGQKAIEELRIQSPLKQNGWSKQQIREMSQKLGLDTAQKPAFACLATRIPHGTPITKDALSAIERAEQCLFSLGFRQVRVRHHGEVARIEVEPEQMPLVLTHKKDILDGVRQAGFRFVTMDLFGYRMGNMNGVSPDEKQNETA